MTPTAPSPRRDPSTHPASRPHSPRPPSTPPTSPTRGVAAGYGSHGTSRPGSYDSAASKEAIAETRRLLSENDRLAGLLTAENRLSTWVAISTFPRSGRSLTVVLDAEANLLAVDHSGERVIATRRILDEVNGSLPNMYWTSARRTSQAFWVLAATEDAAPSNESLARILGDSFCERTAEACFEAWSDGAISDEATSEGD